MWPEEQETEVTPASDPGDEASTEEPSTPLNASSPFASADLEERFYSASRVITTRLDAEESPPTAEPRPAEEVPAPQETPFTTPEVEEIERGAPDSDDWEQRDD